MLQGGPTAQAAFIRAQGLEIATFLKEYIQSNNIPPVCSGADGNRCGGVVVVGWSRGCSIATSFLAHASSFPQEIVLFLERYLRKIVLHGIVCLALFAYDTYGGIWNH